MVHVSPSLSHSESDPPLSGSLFGSVTCRDHGPQRTHGVVFKRLGGKPNLTEKRDILGPLEGRVLTATDRRPLRCRASGTVREAAPQGPRGRRRRLPGRRGADRGAESKEEGPLRVERDRRVCRQS